MPKDVGRDQRKKYQVFPRLCVGEKKRLHRDASGDDCVSSKHVFVRNVKCARTFRIAKQLIAAPDSSYIKRTLLTVLSLELNSVASIFLQIYVQISIPIGKYQ